MNPSDAANVAVFLKRRIESGIGSPESADSLQRVVDHLNAQITRMIQPLPNPAAFPIAHDDRPGAYPAEPGMSLRDYFAANTLPGLLARAWSDPVTGETPDNVHELWAVAAYATADAMLKERDK